MYVDFHSHILPGADHGSEGIEMSLSQIKFARRAGVDTIVATPHFYPDQETVSEFLSRREAAYRELVSNDLGGIRIVKAAEVQLASGIETLPELSELCIEGTDYILLEFPMEPFQDWQFHAVKEIARQRRLRPIIAHIDRYSRKSREKLLKLNVDIQINSSAFLHERKKRVQYLDLIAEDSVHILGSDTHGDGKASYKDFRKATKKIGKLLPYMMENSRKILVRSK